MKGSIVVASIVCLVSAQPCFADDLSFNDFGPWNKGSAAGLGIFSTFNKLPTPINHMPNSGTASYSGATVGSLQNTLVLPPIATPPLTQVSNFAFTGSSSLSTDFSNQTFTATFQNFRSTNLASGGQMSGLPWVGLVRNSITGSVTSIVYAGSINGNSLSGSLKSTDFTTGGNFIGTVTNNSSALNALFFGNKANSVAGTWQANATGSHDPCNGCLTTSQLNAAFAARKP